MKATYRYGVNVQEKHRRWRRVYHIFVMVFVLGLVVVGGAGWFIWRKTQSEQVMGQSTNTVHGVYDPHPTQVYENASFRFSSDEPWVLSKTDSVAPTKYVYSSSRNGLVERQIIIYIDKIPSDLAVTYILPVTPRIDTIAPAAAISPHCGEIASKRTNNNPFQQTYKDISFTCIPDSKSYIAAAGVTKGSYGVALKASDGEDHTVAFVYKDATLKPRPEVFPSVLKSFRLK